MNVNDIVLLACSTVSSVVMVLGGLLGRSRRKQRVVVSAAPSIPLGVRVRGLVEYRHVMSQRTFEVKMPYAPKGFEGSWVCVRLGCGGWGCTYRCEQEGRVAVFKVPRGLESIIEEGEVPTVSEKLLKKVIEEAGVLSKLNHPHILRLLGYSEHIPLLVYEYADYGSMEWQLSNGWKPSIKDLVLIGVQVSDALRYIHSRGLVHGDIKPSNIFFVDGIAKLGDFSSLVKLMSQTSTHSRFAYTPGWRAPEQVYSDLRRKAIELGFENRIDVYQLGNLILYMLIGDTIDGEDAVDEKQVKDLVSMVGHEELRNILHQIMKYNPWERPSAEEVVKELRKVYDKL